jgi:anti-sigma factor RsiW
MLDFLEGRVEEDERKRIEAHVASCAQCARELAELRHIIDLMRTDEGEHAPQHVIHRAVRLFGPPPVPSSPAVDLRRRVLAVLSFDSQGRAPAFGMRSGAEPVARQLLFNADQHVVDVRIQPEGEAWIVAGQVFGESTINASAELLGATGAGHAALSEQSEFVLPSVQAGRYKLILHLSDMDIELDELNVGT